METQNSGIGSAGKFKQMPTKNTQKSSLPPHSDPKEGFMGAEESANGRMGTFYKNTSNTE